MTLSALAGAAADLLRSTPGGGAPVQPVQRVTLSESDRTKLAAAGECGCGQSDCATCGGGDTVELSAAGRDALTAGAASSVSGASVVAAVAEESRAADSPAHDEPGELSVEEREQVEELERRDREVRQHEAAHLAAAGPHARGGPTFEYQTGPDGRRYAIGGEVQIDTSPVADDPAATIAKMEQIRTAALAPAEPSAADRRIAAEATARISRARAEQNAARTEDGEPQGPAGPRGSDDSIRRGAGPADAAAGGPERDARTVGALAAYAAGNRSRGTSAVDVLV